MEEDDGAEQSAREALFRFLPARAPAAPAAAASTCPRRPPPPPPPPPRGFLSALEGQVQFPALHWSWGCDVDTKDCFDAWEAKNDVTVLEGRYREVRAIQPLGAPEREAGAWARAAGPDAGCAYLVLGFCARAPPPGAAALAPALLAAWRDWSGARHLYLHLPDELRLARVALLERVDGRALPRQPPRPPPPFQFLVVAACRCAGSPLLQARLLDFAQRLRAQRVSAAFVSVYSAQTTRAVATF